MPFDGSGNFSRLYSWQSDRDNGIRILASRMDGEFDNFAAGMNVVFFRNGLVPMSGNLNLGQNYIVGLGAGSVGAPALRFGDDPNSGMYLNGLNKPTIIAGGTARLEANTVGVQVYGAFNASGAATVQGNFTTIGTSALNGDVSIGAASSPAPGVLRYLDVWNQDTTNNGSGSIFRLITKNLAGTANTTVDMVKYKNGQFAIVNNEPNAAASLISFGVTGSTPLTLTQGGVFTTALTASGAATFNGGASAGTFTANSSIVIGDSTYYLTKLSNNPIINFDPNDYLQFDRTANTLSANIGGGNRWQVDATTMRNYVNSALRGIVRFGTSETQNIDADASTLYMRGTNLAFQDAGATTSFVWGNSSGLGVGSTNPAGVGGTRNIHLYSTGTSIIKSEGSAAGRLDLASATTNAYVAHQVNDNTGSPYYQVQSGSAVNAQYNDFENHFFRTRGGSDKVVIESNGNVRIGSPLGGAAAALDVQRAGTATSDIRVRNGSVGAGVFVDSATAYAGSLSNHTFSILQNNVTRMSFDTSGNAQFGNGQNTGAGQLRYFDLYNLENSNNTSGVDLRLITRNVAGTASTTVDIVKNKNGAFTINNTETDGAASINLAVSSNTQLQLTNGNTQVLGSMGVNGTATFNSVVNVAGTVNIGALLTLAANKAIVQHDGSNAYYRANTGSMYLGAGGTNYYQIDTSGRLLEQSTGREMGYKDANINSQGGAYTIAAADRGGTVYFGSGTGALTVPTNASVALPNGTVVSVINDSGNARTISPAGGVVIKWAGSGTTGARTLGNGGMASLIKVSTDTWFVSGAGLS